VLNGHVYSEFSLNDLCPFVGGSAGSPYCFVFSDHPQFPTVSALLAARLPNGLSWASTTFYYVPFTLQALGQILLDMNVVNTLLTNSMFSESVIINTTNYAQFGPSVALFARHMMTLIGTNPSAATALSDMCNESRPINPETIQALYTTIMG
jgi:hypothetical protein